MLMKGLKHFHDIFVFNRVYFLQSILRYGTIFLAYNFQKSSEVLIQFLFAL